VVKATYDKVTLEASLRDGEGEAVPDKAIRILWGGVVVKNSTTDKNGVITVQEPRPNQVTSLSADWPDALHVKGQLLLPDDPHDPVLVTDEKFPIGLRTTEQLVDPTSLTSGPALLYQTINDFFQRFFGKNGQKVASIIVLLVLGGPYVVGIFAVLKKLVRWQPTSSDDTKSRTENHETSLGSSPSTRHQLEGAGQNRSHPGED
jgi:hypothetical protein